MNNPFFAEQLGVEYVNALVPVDLPPGAAVDATSGDPVPVQEVPATPFDKDRTKPVRLAKLSVKPRQTVRLEPSNKPIETTITVTTDADGRTIIRNGEISLALPASGYALAPFPGPIAGIRIGEGAWFAASQVVDAPVPGHVEVKIESLGPACVQWRTSIRWGGHGGIEIVARWAAGADTIEFAEEATDDSDAAVELLPVPGQASAYYRGGGEGVGPMTPLQAPDLHGARRQPGRRLLGRISHISYWNQWNYPWVGFVGDGDAFVGVFSARGGDWTGRGKMRIDIYEDDARGAMLRFPIRRGRRFWGMVITTRAASDMDSKERRTLLNRRKTQLSDLRIDKVRHWVLDLPLEPKSPRLIDRAMLDGLFGKWARDERVAPNLRRLLDVTSGQNSHHCARFAAAYALGDAKLASEQADPQIALLRRNLAAIAEGGYERLIIFDGRWIKPLSYDVDAMWARGLIDEVRYRELRAGILAIAYMFVDPDYTNYTDFWMDDCDPSEGIKEAMALDMGDCPVPPNFACEFFSTTAVAAELCPSHPMTPAWRKQTVELLRKFGEVYYAPDGTYLESINYHHHSFNALLLQIWAQRHTGTNDATRWPWVRGSFQHFVDVHMQPLSAPLPEWSKAIATIYLTPAGQKVSAFPNNGNSGSEANMQMQEGMLTVGSYLYQQQDPELSRQLMSIFHEGGQPILDHVHPLLTIACYDPARPAAAAPWRSSHRQTLGVISKSKRTDGTPLHVLFRAGRATHHMDFDQGHISLAFSDRVLLGDPGYHMRDSDGHHLPAAATHVHNTLVYSDDEWWSSGYTGLEEAPEPVKVHLGDDFDWCVHRIVNTNFRRLNAHPYNRLAPAPRTVHVRHYLCVKPDYVVLWDTFEEAHAPATCFLHPYEPMTRAGQNTFRAGVPGRPHLLAKFLLPQEVNIVHDRPMGRLHHFAIRGEVGQPFLTILRPQIEDQPLEAAFDAASRVLKIQSGTLRHTITLPPPGSPTELPRVTRG